MPWYKSLTFIVLSTLLLNAPFWGAFYFYKERAKERKQDARYQVKKIVSHSEHGELLRPEIIAEWLNLSVDRPVNLYALNRKRIQKVLKTKLVVKSAKVSIDPPSTLVVLAEMRDPIAFVGERRNIALDIEGSVFPLSPFYTPKKLPKLFTGKKENFKIAQKVLRWLKEREKLDEIQTIDVTRAKASSLGEREVVIQRKGAFGRLNPDFIESGLERFFKIRPVEGAQLDLRIEGLMLYDGDY